MAEKIDSILLKLVQRFIADPLQKRGISLLAQYRALASFGAAAAVMMAVNVLQLHIGEPYTVADIFSTAICLAMVGILVATKLAEAIWPDWPNSDRSARLSPPPTEESAMANRIKSHYVVRIAPVTLFSLFAVFGYISKDSTTLIQLIYWAEEVLKSYIDACDAKPPRPKRVLVLATELG